MNKGTRIKYEMLRRKLRINYLLLEQKLQRRLSWPSLSFATKHLALKTSLDFRPNVIMYSKEKLLTPAFSWGSPFDRYSRELEEVILITRFYKIHGIFNLILKI